MGEWTPAADDAIKMCEAWAGEVAKLVGGELFLFGSAIYKNGEQFDAQSSDLDIVYLFPEPTSTGARFDAMRKLRERKEALELQMVSRLHRNTCDEPGVSVVPITALELCLNIHKSGARRFFDKNFFYDLLNGRQTLVLPAAGTRAVRDEVRQALEYTQKLRNEYLAVAANGLGGIAPYAGADPMPKALLRSAAQLLPDSAEGEWYDTRLGLEYLHKVLHARRGADPPFQALANRISVRRGGRGRLESLSADDQLLLAEMLFDEAAKFDTEEVIIWEIRVHGGKATEEDAKEVAAAISRIVPGAKLIGFRPGSVVLRMRGPISGFELLKKLNEMSVLTTLLDVERVLLWRLTDGEALGQATDGTRPARLAKELAEWRPQEIDPKLVEAEFARYLQSVISKEGPLHGAHVLRDVRFHDVEMPFEMDFLLTWSAQDGSKERMGVDLAVLRSASAFFYRVALLLPLGRPVILLLVAKQELLDGLRGDIVRLGQLNANIRVVPVPAAWDKSTVFG